MEQKSATSYFKIAFFSLLIILFLVLLFGGFYYWKFAEKPSQLESTSRSSPVPPSSNELVATDRVEVYLSPGKERVGYFVAGQKFIPTGKEEREWIQVIDSNKGYQLWIRKGSSYKPAKP